ncbi:MAG TPA: ORC1-type DNA replication protein, partial [Thermoprotei archaeon]|nr:ORC1-type DNA replication protein [Thermoprotei archaeon]
MDLWNYWEKCSRIFINEYRISSLEYIPSRLPHRERQIGYLTEIFRPVVRNPGKISQKAVFIGRTGTGKTVTAKFFGKKLEKYLLNKGFSFKYIHINCHKDRSLYLVSQRIASELKLKIPLRGYSYHEIFYLIFHTLSSNNMAILVTLDEIDYLKRNKENDSMYFLSRINDEFLDENASPISFIFITRDPNFFEKMEESIKRCLIHNKIDFPPYTATEIIDILRERIVVEKAMRKKAVSNEILEIIGDLTGYDKGGTGDARLALEILWKAGIEAERSGKNFIEIEDVRKAFNNINPLKINIEKLDRHEKMILKATVAALKSSKNRYVSTGEIIERYK